MYLSVPASRGTVSMKVMGAGSNLDAPAGYEEFKNVNEVFINEGYEPTSQVNDLAVLRVRRKGGFRSLLLLSEMFIKFSVFLPCIVFLCH